MSRPSKGSIIVADGNGKVKAVSPTNDNEMFISDSTKEKGGRFVDAEKILQNSTFKSVITDSSSTNSETYFTIMYFTVPGENVNKIQSIKILSKKKGNLTSYSVRIYDATNNNVIVENTFTNNSILINDIGILSNLPTNEAIVEVQAKRNDGNRNSYAIISECTIEFRNV